MGLVKFVLRFVPLLAAAFLVGTECEKGLARHKTLAEG